MIRILKMTNMKNAVLILILSLCSSLYGQKSKPSPSKWNSSGKDEITLPKENLLYFSKGKIYYYLSNDNDNIYLDMRIDDSEAQNKILKQGMTVWINVDDKQIKKCGIRFPIGTENPAGPGQGRQFGQELQESSGLNRSPVSQANRIELTGFTKEERRIIPSNNEDNFRGTVHYNNEGVLIYKMILPVSRIETDKNMNTNPIALGIELGGAAGQVRQGPPQSGGPSNEFSNPVARSGGRSGGGGGGGRPSGGGPGGGGFNSSGGAPPAQPAAKTTIMWIKDITLVAEK